MVVDLIAQTGVADLVETFELVEVDQKPSGMSRAMEKATAKLDLWPRLSTSFCFTEAASIPLRIQEMLAVVGIDVC